MQTSSVTTVNLEDCIYRSLFHSRIINGSVAFVFTLATVGCWTPAKKPSVAEINKLIRIPAATAGSPLLESIPDPIDKGMVVCRHDRNISSDFPLVKNFHRTGGVIIAGIASPDDNEHSEATRDNKKLLSLAIFNDRAGQSVASEFSRLEPPTKPSGQSVELPP